MHHFYFFLFSLLLISNNNILLAQEEIKAPGLRFYLSEDKTSYAGVVIVNQIWSRYTQNNPDRAGNPQPSDYDMGLRRGRLIFYSYFHDKVFIYTQLGTDGLSFNFPGNPQITLFNAETEYIISKDKLHVGLGLNTWNGISRYNNSKLLEFLVVDNPGFAFPTAGTFDRLGRQFGVYFKGTIGSLHYRASVVKPFQYGVDSALNSNTTEIKNTNTGVKAYLTWQFFDKENHLFPYMTMNNLGRAKLFNLGAGFYYQPEAMTANISGQHQFYNIFLAGIDAFLDMPLPHKAAITSYLGIYYNDFGPDFLKASGMMNVRNIGNMQSLSQGAGNRQWETGTGTIIRGELGYLLPVHIKKSRLQPFGAFSYKDFEGLDESSLQWDFGANLFLAGHNLKWTMQYSTRPIYNQVNGRNIIIENKGQIIVQSQIFF